MNPCSLKPQFSLIYSNVLRKYTATGIKSGYYHKGAAARTGFMISKAN